MGKASRKKNKAAAAAKPKRQEVAYVERPFEGIDGELDLIAMREILPMATAELALKDGSSVTLVTLLPEQIPAIKCEDGTLLVAMQTRMHSGDASRDLAYVIEKGQELEPGFPFLQSELPEPGPRLQDIIDPGTPVRVTIAEDFSFWLDPNAEIAEETRQAIQEASEASIPMAPVPGAPSAFWARMGKEYLRWVRGEDETALLNALARLHANRETELEDGVPLIGAFRTCGVLIPVWELIAGTEAEELEGPAAEFEKRLAAAMANSEPLSYEEKRVRDGLISRQVNLR